MSVQDLIRLTASDAASLIASGALSAEELARACLARIAARNAETHAWAFVDPDQVIAQARLLDATPAECRGRLHGVPVGVKDVILTADMPTGQNSSIYAGNRPGIDANCIMTLRAAGALILGKTATTEFAATVRGGPARNPIDLARTPGGSSSGSGAAVGDRHVPLALGTQTGGSTIRPASFCGVFGFKPSWNAISREGLRMLAPSLDTLGLYARSLEDLILLGEVFRLRGGAPQTTPERASLRFGICHGAAWDRAEPATRDALARAAALLQEAGAIVEELALPEAFETLPQHHRTLMQVEGAASFLGEDTLFPDALHSEFRSTVAHAADISRNQITSAYDEAASCRHLFDGVAAGYDAILTPSTLGEAPLGQASTGDASSNSVWTLLHVPVVHLPLFIGRHRMPVGVSLVAPRYTDRRLLDVARSVWAMTAGHHDWDPLSGTPTPR